MFLKEFNERCEVDGKPLLVTGLGLSSGTAMVGNMGAPARLNYTAVGDIVNLASRLEGTTKLFGTGILCAEATRQEAGDEFEWRLVDLVAVKGKTLPVKIYEPLGVRGSVPQADLDFARSYEAGFERYLKREFADALKALDGARRLRPEDLSYLRLEGLCKEYLDDPPPAEWDGVERLKTK
ncbi:MAG: adenylate/guanylate cyclase domain-containing protein [Planctomycetota bacterium]|nr:adenylate/guanylate cyclase domain-containing protein [Planctomycetota bacterium]